MSVSDETRIDNSLIAIENWLKEQSKSSRTSPSKQKLPWWKTKKIELSRFPKRQLRQQFRFAVQVSWTGHVFEALFSYLEVMFG